MSDKKRKRYYVSMDMKVDALKVIEGGEIVIKVENDLNSHKPIFLRMKNPVNMLEVLLEELDSRTDWKSFDEDDKRLLRLSRIKISRFDDGEKRERLSVEKILEMAHQLNERDLNRKKMKVERKERKKWLGKKKRRKSKSSGVEEKTKENHSKNELKGDFNKRRNRNKQNRGSSVSSVDSDYQKENGPLELSKDGPNFKIQTDILSNPFDRSTHKFPIAKSKYYHEGKCQSRDSSISSSYSLDVDPGKEKASHVSRYSLTHNSFTSSAKDESSLTAENLAAFDPSNSNIVSRRMSMLSLPSVDTRSNSSLESLSVMERVKQSYQMLTYKKDGKSINNDNISSTNKKREPSKKGKQNNMNNIEPPRSQSCQGLNVQPSNTSKNLFLGGYKSSFSSRDSSIDSNRSFSFMPSFSSKKSEKDAGQ